VFRRKTMVLGGWRSDHHSINVATLENMLEFLRGGNRKRGCQFVQLPRINVTH
jgi:hypothetical protein